MAEMVALEAARRVLKSENVSMSNVLAALEQDVEQDKAKTPAAPDAIPMTPELSSALQQVYQVFGRVNPGEVRKLSDIENRLLLEENRVLDAVVKTLTTRLEQTKVIARNHMHCLAVEQGLGNGETDQLGHALVAAQSQPYQVPVEGSNMVWSLQYSKGSTTLDTSVLRDMVDTGEITTKQYNSMTRAVRVFDEAKATQALQKDPGLLKVIKRMVKRGRPSTALYVRKQK